VTDRDHFAAALSVVRRIDLWLERDEADDADQTLREARTSLISLAARLDYADAIRDAFSGAGNTGLAGKPTLTDAERFVLREVRDTLADEDDVACNEIAAVIDGLLERTK